MTNLYLDDKDFKNDLIMNGLSDCCGVPSNSDIMICSMCQEHCGIYYDNDDE